MVHRRGYGLVVPSSRRRDRRPADHVVAGTWPDGTVADDDPAASAAQALARNLAAATDGMSLRQVADRTGVDHTTVRDVLKGLRWADTVTVALLEDALGPLWPGPRPR